MSRRNYVSKAVVQAEAKRVFGRAAFTSHKDTGGYRGWVASVCLLNFSDLDNFTSIECYSADSEQDARRRVHDVLAMLPTRKAGK